MNEFKNKEIILIGLEQDMILELLKSKHKILGYFGNKKKNNSIKFLGSIGKIKYFLKKNKNVKICISMGPLEIRKKLIKKFKNNILTYISDEAIVSKNAVIGVGSFIQSFCFIGNNTKIGKCCKINVRSNIHHDTKIGSFTDLAPSVTILGNVRYFDIKSMLKSYSIVPWNNIADLSRRWALPENLSLLMVKSDNPRKVFDKYKTLYNKVSNVKKSIVTKENNFFS